MGYFSLPMAKMVGDQGKVICIDLQDKMLERLVKRATKEDLLHRIETRVCSYDSLKVSDMKEEIDFVLAFAMIHEVKDKERLYKELYEVLKPKGTLLVVEPKGHVSEKDFAYSMTLCEESGFTLMERPVIGKSNGALFQKGIAFNQK
ncbi:class I SAM-dependent methyltransferase [Heliorestis convoluta]|uniref:Class I SAM-dependent methyltransferase n=2 Tax=Heliorestis convoluta TaxID=356322 RepID=A0A5Q2N3X5_9FIRM|nr:class I SAM-dependent methyltransferase [Heliorestis convoluta]